MAVTTTHTHDLQPKADISSARLRLERETLYSLVVAWQKKGTGNTSFDALPTSSVEFALNCQRSGAV